ncbi:hypothetical protein Pfo_018851 [Paulownia fortunei]|nr:hypothetical protein Pfo_018851 [Paulownia fortunei]
MPSNNHVTYHSWKGYTNFSGFLSPYPGERYHILEWTGDNKLPSTRNELFNRRHLIVRNHIEWCFGAIKKRFPILRGLMPNYFLCMQVELVVVCCCIHNLI